MPEEYFEAVGQMKIEKNNQNKSRDFDQIEQLRRESVDIKINPFMMNRQIKNLEVPFKKANPKFKCLAQEIDNTCGVCISKFLEDEYVVQLKCNPAHTFHSDCLFKWAKFNYKCPVCRASVISSPEMI